MMTLNNNEKDFQEKLQKDTEMPAIVHERINQAYRLIENNAADFTQIFLVTGSHRFELKLTSTKKAGNR